MSDNYQAFVEELKKKKDQSMYVFAIQFIGVFGATFLLLAYFNLVPQEINVFNGFRSQTSRNLTLTPDVPTTTQTNQTASQPTTQTKPDRIVISKIDVDTHVLQPQSTQVEVLDQYLQQGAVYYPGSGTIEKGNIFVFGHSTNWAIVQNQAYKTFNNLEKLVKGDTIEVYANGQKYTYQVNDVRLANDSEALVHLSSEGQYLTISTCNTFGKKQERWVVTAKRV